MAKYVGEVLSELNKNVNLFNGEYKKSGNGGPLGVIFYHAFTKNGKFDLPAGDPPFKPAPEPLGMTPSQFITETRKFHYFCNTRLTSAKREMLFVQMCESIHPDEAKILCAIKDQKLHEMYPNLTPQVAAKAGFVNAEDLIEVVVEKKKSSKSKNVKGTGKSDTLQDESQQSQNLENGLND